MNSIWLNHSKYPNYLFSPEGDVLSLKPNRNFDGKTKVKNKCDHVKGYDVVSIVNKDMKRGTKLVHRLIAEVFCENMEGKKQVNHIDGNKKNNHYINLEWVTNQENRDHAVKSGLIAKGERACHKLTDIQVGEIRRMWNDGSKGMEIAIKYGVSRGYVYDIVNNRRRTK